MRNSNVYLWCLQKVSSAPQIYFPQKMVNSFPNSEAELKNKGEKILLFIMIIMLSARYPPTGPVALLSRCFLYP